MKLSLMFCYPIKHLKIIIIIIRLTTYNSLCKHEFEVFQISVMLGENSPFYFDF